MTASKMGLWWDSTGTAGDEPQSSSIVFLAPGARPVRYFSSEWIGRIAAATDRPAVRIDLPGQGRSPSADGPLVFDDIVTELHATLGAIGSDSFHLIGVGISGTLALALAERDSAAVRSVGAISTSAYVADPALPGADEMLVASISIRQDTSTPEAVFATLLNHERRLGGVDEAEQVRAWVDWGVDPSERYRRLFLTTRIDDQRLTSLATPTLVIHGADDPMIPPAHADHLASTLANGELALIAGMGHGLTTGVQTAIADKIIAHIAKAEA